MRAQVVGLLLLVACAPSSSGVGPGTGPGGTTTPADRTFAAECEVQCRSESEDAGCTVPTCVEDCIALSGGLETLCGKCIVAQTDVYSYTDDGTCDVDGTLSLNACSVQCSPSSHRSRPDFHAECEVQCRWEADDAGCAMPTCVDDCVAMTRGLETQCGKCVVAQTEVYSYTDDGTCGADIGTIDASACDEHCLPATHATRTDFRSECAAQCRIEADEAGCTVPTCVDDCVAMTLGLENQCGKCIVAQTNIYSYTDDGTCGQDIASLEDGSCDEDCFAGTHQARPDFRAECQVQCRAEAEDAGCPMLPTCVDDCVATTAGLETQCGKCVVMQTEVYRYTDDDTCDLDVGTVDSGACDEVCNR